MRTQKLLGLMLIAMLGFGLSLQHGLGMEGAIAPQSQRGTQVAQAAPAAPTTARFYTNRAGVAIDGTDPVAYFLARRPIAGRKEFTHQWMGATWWFSSAANRDRFIANPNQYAPQYGGFCAWAVSQGYSAPTDPQAWTIHNGKLYLNYDLNVHRRWARDIPGNIKKGDRNWPTVQQKLG